MHFLDYFDRIEVINLESRQDRKREVIKQLSRLGKESCSEPIRWFNAICPSDKAEFPSIGARGCFESHLNILQRARDDEVKKLLIIEDDLNFSDDIICLSPKFHDLLKEKNWGFSYLAHQHDSVGTSKYPDLIELDSTAVIRCTHLIGISGDILPDLVGYLEKMKLRNGGDPKGGPMHVDGAYNWYRNASQCITVIATPPLGYQRSSRSDIAEKKVYDKIPIVKEIINYIRKFKKHA